MTMENEAVEEALKIIDKALQDISGREIVSSAEMSDILLDMRLLFQSN